MHSHTRPRVPPWCCQGEYKDGEPHGNAVFIEADGKAYEEVWQGGKRKKRTLVTTITFTGPSASSTSNAANSASSVPSSGANGSTGNGVVPAGTGGVGTGRGGAHLALPDLILELDAATLVGGPKVKAEEDDLNLDDEIDEDGDDGAQAKRAVLRIDDRRILPAQLTIIPVCCVRTQNTSGPVKPRLHPLPPYMP